MARTAILKQIISLDEKDFDSKIFEHLPRFTEDVTGEHIEPINVILVGSESDLQKAFALAGWQAAAPISFTSTLKLVFAELRNTADRNAPGLPVFLDGLPNDKTYEQSTNLNSVRERHHLHLWTTNVTDGVIPVWVGSVHLDTSGTLYRGLTYHKIDPDVDKARAWLSGDLSRSNCGQGSVGVWSSLSCGSNQIRLRAPNKTPSF